MTPDPRDLFRGSFIVAKRDFAANAKSIRVVVVTLLTLLVMVGAALGIRGLAPTGPGVAAEYVLWASPAYPDGGGLGGIVAFVSDVFGEPKPGVAIALGEPYPLGDPDPVFLERETKLTDAGGWTSFADLGEGFWPLELSAPGITYESGVLLAATRPTTQNFTASYHRFDILADGSVRDLAIQAVAMNGTPAEDAGVTQNGPEIGRTDANGFFWARLDPGTYVVNVTYLGETQGQPVFVPEPSILLPIYQGPDGVLYFLAFGIMGLFAPIVAVAVSYDALAKERMQGSLELLLVRPASRTGLAIGKFLGTFASVALPMFGVLLASLLGINAVTGKWPDAGFATAFVLGTLALLATYILIMQIFSTVVKSPGTAILSAIMVWLVFNLIWNIVYVLISAALGVQGGTPEAFLLSALTLLFNPTGVYQLTVAAAIPPSLFGGGGGGELPDWSGPAAFAVWIGVLLVLAVIAFKRRAV